MNEEEVEEKEEIPIRTLPTTVQQVPSAITAEFLTYLSDMSNVITLIENNLRGYYLTVKTDEEGNKVLEWEKKGEQKLSDNCINNIKSLLYNFLNPNIFYSNWKYERIEDEVIEFAIQLFPILQMELKNNPKLTYPEIILLKQGIVVNVESALMRAMNEGERRFANPLLPPLETKKSFLDRVLGK